MNKNYIFQTTRYSMIEMYCLKNAVIFIQTILSFVLPRKIKNISIDIARKCANVTVKDFRKYEKLEYKKNKLKLKIDFSTNANNLVYPKFLSLNCRMFLMKPLYQFVIRLLCNAINKGNKELQHLPKKLSPSKNFLSTQLSNGDYYILTKSIT